MAKYRPITAGTAVDIADNILLGGGGGYLYTAVDDGDLYVYRRTFPGFGSSLISGVSPRTLNTVVSVNDSTFIITSSTATSTTRSVRRPTATTLDLIGTFTTPSGDEIDFFASSCDYDATVALIAYGSGGVNDTLAEIDLSDGSKSWSLAYPDDVDDWYDWACAGPDRIFAVCSTHVKLELWEGSTSTLLDDIAYPLTVDDALDSYIATRPLPGGRLFYINLIDGSSPPEFFMGVLSTVGDELAWEWQDTLVTDWDVPDGFPSISSWGDVVVLAPEDTSDLVPLRLYAIDAITGDVSSSEPDPEVGNAAYDWGWVDANRFAFTTFDEYAAPWSITRVVSRVLRQRQSPKRSPSRVGTSYHLRQRQTPFIA